MDTPLHTDQPEIRQPQADLPQADLPQAAADSSAKPAERLLQVGELAQAVGKTVRAIHHYEELGLIVPSARSKGRFRLYDVDAVTRVRWISKLHDLGLSLIQIQEIASAFEGAPSAGQATAIARETYVQKLAETRAQIDHLKCLESELESSIAYLDACGCDSRVDAEKEALIREKDLLLSNRVPVRRAPTQNEGSCSDHQRAPEVGSCITCDQRQRGEEPELVAGLLSSSKTASSKSSPFKSAKR